MGVSGAPCLSFDIINDELGENRADFPLTCYVIAGTQASRSKENNLIVMKMSNLQKTYKEKADDSEDSGESDSEEEEDNLPRLDYASIAHYGCINRIRVGRRLYRYILKQILASGADECNAHGL